MYYPCSENKGADQLRGYREADLRLCFRIWRLLVFPRGGSFVQYIDPFTPHSNTGFQMSLFKINLFITINCDRQCALYFFVFLYMSRPVRKPTICIGENKDADQLRGNREADQRLCFRYSDSTIPLLLKSKISSF